MGNCDCESFKSKQKISNFLPNIRKGPPLIRCTYDVKDYNLVQIMNNRGEKYINEEIESKIKILNGDKREPLVFQKKFSSPGMNTIIFIIEGNLNNMSYLFNKCISLKKVEFFSFENIRATKMIATFQMCEQLEYLDISNLNTSNVTSM